MANNWLYRFKLKIIAGLVLLLALATVSAMLVVIDKVRDSLLDDSAENIRGLGNVIASGLKNNMLRHSPEHIQASLRDIGNSDRISKIFILNISGQVVFSSVESDIGTLFDKTTNLSCVNCHHTGNNTPANKTTILRRDTGDILRNVIIIYNEPACFGCHPRDNRVNGKLIIDHPLAGTEALVNKIRFIILFIIPIFGLICLLLFIPILSRMIDRYIEQIMLKNNEINLIYSIIDSISRTIDLEELKTIALDIVSNIFAADEVDLILPNGEDGFRIITLSNNGKKYQRKKLNPEETLANVVNRWRDGQLKTQEHSENRTEVYLPIEKGEVRLALIVCRCMQRPFSDEKLKLMEVICTHFGIAFENARLYSIAITDELTGLFTVRHFRFCIDRQMESFINFGEKFCLLIIDIDNFKKVNDTYGHPTGDFVLKKVAACIAEFVRGVRRSNDVAFRYGGEEFTVILPSTSLAGGLQVAERIRSQIEASNIVVDGHLIGATVSIGLAACPDNAISIKELILEADKSLYSAKHGGKNMVVVSEKTPE